MKASIEEALKFIKKKSRKSLERNRMLALSLAKEIEIVGEAAAKISSEFKKKHPQIPWKIIVDTRNRFIHGYFDIDLDILWNVISIDFKDLLKQLKKL